MVRVWDLMPVNAFCLKTNFPWQGIKSKNLRKKPDSQRKEAFIYLRGGGGGGGVRLLWTQSTIHYRISGGGGGGVLKIGDCIGQKQSITP